MNDIYLMKSREKVFERYRKVLEEVTTSKDLVKKARDKLNRLEKEKRELARTIDIMIKKDCCPTEAKLKYGEEIDDNDDDDDNFDDDDSTLV